MGNCFLQQVGLFNGMFLFVVSKTYCCLYALLIQRLGIRYIYPVSATIELVHELAPTLH